MGVTTAAASLAHVTLVDATLTTQVLPHSRHPKHLVDDRGLDTDPLREEPAARALALIAPYRGSRKCRPHEDRLRLRRYRHWWIIERTITRFRASRRLLIRHERFTRMYPAFVQLASALIVLRRVTR